MDLQASIELYIQACTARGLRLDTLKSYSYDLYAFQDYLPSKDTAFINCDLLRQYLNTHKNNGLKLSTIERKRKSIVLWLSWLNREGIVELEDIKNRVGCMKLDHATPRTMNDEEIHKFLTAAETMRHGSRFAKLRDIALLRIMLDTGLRRSEIMRLTLDDVDLKRRFIYVSSEAKGRKSRTVMFTVETLHHLRGYLKERKPVNTNALWLNIFGEAGTYSIIKMAVLRVARAAGLANIHPHTLRHSFATKCIRAGIPLTSVQKLLGHTDVKTTMIYVHIEDEVALADYERYFNSKVG